MKTGLKYKNVMWSGDIGSENGGKNMKWQDQDKNHYVEVLNSESPQHFFPERKVAERK